MSDNAKKDDVVVLGGREFKRVKNGLDEVQVAPFIDELTEERDKLAQSQDHIASLNRLAEMTVVESDKLATQIKTEAEEQAKAEGTAIMDKAKEQARQMAEQKIAEAVEVANEKANAIQVKADEEAALMLENERNKIRSELHNLVNQQFGYMLEELENLKKQAAAVQADFDIKLAKPQEENSAAAMEIAKESDAIAAKITEESDAIAAKIAEESDAAAAEIAEETDTTVAEEKDTAAAEITEERDTAVAEEEDAAAAEITEGRDTTTAQQKDTAAAEIAEEKGTTVEEQSKVPDEHPEPSQTADYIEKSLDLSKLFEGGAKPDLGNPQWEVEILPPFNIGKIMEVVSFLDQLPEVENTEMIVPQIDTPSILVFLREEMDFIDMLRTIPAVAHVEEVTTDGDAANGKPRKARIGLSGNAIPQEKK